MVQRLGWQCPRPSYFAFPLISSVVWKLIRSHFEHRFLAPSSKLGQNWLHHRRGTLISAQLSADMVSTLWKVWVPTRLCQCNIASKHAHTYLNSNNFGFLCAGVSNVLSFKKKRLIRVLLQTYCHLSIIEKLFISWHFFESYGMNYGRGWRKAV